MDITDGQYNAIINSNLPRKLKKAILGSRLSEKNLRKREADNSPYHHVLESIKDEIIN